MATPGTIPPIGPTPERLAKAEPEQVEIVSAGENEHWQAIRLTDAHILEYLRTRGCITGDQYSAGQQFYSDWYTAGLASSGVIDPGRVIVDGGQIEHTSDRQLYALNRWQRAIKAVGKIHSGVLIDLVLTEEPLQDWGRRRCGQRSAKLARLAAQVALRFSLEALDLHYHGTRQNRTRASHMPDYRPEIHTQDAEP